MKNLYNAPVITVEELTKKDVLCSSGDSDINPDVYDNAALSGNEGGSQGLGGMTDVI